jgi:hypothetical protein
MELGINGRYEKFIKQITIRSHSLLVLVAYTCLFFLIDNIWINEIDENNALIAQRTEIEHLQLDVTSLGKSLYGTK